MLEVIPMVGLDQLPDLETTHEDTVSLILYPFQFLRSYDLVLFRRGLGCCYLRVDIYINGDVLADLLTVCLFLAPIISDPQLIQLRIHLNLDQFDMFDPLRDQDFSGGRIDDIHLNAILIVIVRIPLMHNSHLQ
jgi:hypothetical protein